MIFWSAKKQHKDIFFHPPSPVIFATAIVVACVLLCNSRFTFHGYAQREAMPTQKLAWKWRCDFRQKIPQGIHSCKPASLNRTIHTSHHSPSPMHILKYTISHTRAAPKHPLTQHHSLESGIRASSWVCSLHLRTPTSWLRGKGLSGFFRPTWDVARNSFLSTLGCVWWHAMSWLQPGKLPTAGLHRRKQNLGEVSPHWSYIVRSNGAAS